MIKPIHLLIGIASFIVAHILTFYQLNGQFLKSTDWFRKNILIVAGAGIILSFFYLSFIYGELNMQFPEWEVYCGLLDL